MTTPLLLLPGMMCDGRLFAPQIAALADRSVTVGAITEGETTAEIADAVLAATPDRFALAGLSMGGIVAMEMLARPGARDRIAGLCLMDTNAEAESERVAARRDPQIASALAGGLAAVMREEMMPFYLADGAGGAGAEAILDTCLAMALDQGPEVFAKQSRALQRRPDRREVLASVDVPTLILCGAQDRLCPPHRHDTMAGLIDGAVLEVIADAGHLPTLERPEAVTGALQSWLRTVDARETKDTP